MSITLETQGRRIYVRGNTYPIKNALRDIGAKWDADARAWWIGTTKRTALEELVAKLGGSTGSAVAPASGSSEPRREAPGEDAKVAARATYKGRTYYVAGRVERGRTNWDDEVEPVYSRDGSRVLLYFRDGSSQFWAAREAVRIEKSYRRPTTIRSLREYAAQKREDRQTGTCSCSCHREANAGAPGTTLYDGCERCGCEAC